MYDEQKSVRMGIGTEKKKSQPRLAIAVAELLGIGNDERKV